MRIIARTIVILLAAGLVVAATLALGGSSTSGAGQRQPAGLARERAAPPDGAFEGRGRGERGGGLFAAGELLKSLVIIAVIVAIVAPLSRWLANRRRRQLRA
jgi:hypothetical protein